MKRISLSTTSTPKQPESTKYWELRTQNRGVLRWNWRYKVAAGSEDYIVFLTDRQTHIMHQYVNNWSNGGFPSRDFAICSGYTPTVVEDSAAGGSVIAAAATGTPCALCSALGKPAYIDVGGVAARGTGIRTAGRAETYVMAAVMSATPVVEKEVKYDYPVRIYMLPFEQARLAFSAQDEDFDSWLGLQYKVTRKMERNSASIGVPNFKKQLTPQQMAALPGWVSAQGQLAKIDLYKAFAPFTDAEAREVLGRHKAIVDEHHCHNRTELRYNKEVVVPEYDEKGMAEVLSGKVEAAPAAKPRPAEPTPKPTTSFDSMLDLEENDAPF